MMDRPATLEIAPSTVRHIAANRTWRHLPAPGAWRAQIDAALDRIYQERA